MEKSESPLSPYNGANYFQNYFPFLSHCVLKRGTMDNHQRKNEVTVVNGIRRKICSCDHCYSFLKAIKNFCDHEWELVRHLRIYCKYCGISFGVGKLEMDLNTSWGAEKVYSHVKQYPDSEPIREYLRALGERGQLRGQAEVEEESYSEIEEQDDRARKRQRLKHTFHYTDVERASIAAMKEPRIM